DPSAGRKPPFPALRHRDELPREDPLEKIQEPGVVKKTVGLVAVEIRLPRIGEVFLVVLVQFDDLLNQRLVARKICAVEKALWVEFLGNQRVAPVNGQGARCHGLENLLGRVAWMRTV